MSAETQGLQAHICPLQVQLISHGPRTGLILKEFV